MQEFKISIFKSNSIKPKGKKKYLPMFKLDNLPWTFALPSTGIYLQTLPETTRTLQAMKKHNKTLEGKWQYLIREVVNDPKIETTEEKIPNIFEDWHETHYYVSIEINKTHTIEGTRAYKRFKDQGTGGLWKLSEELTNEFEKLYKNKEWDGEWLDVLGGFIHQKLYN